MNTTTTASEISPRGRSVRRGLALACSVLGLTALTFGALLAYSWRV